MENWFSDVVLVDNGYDVHFFLDTSASSVSIPNEPKKAKTTEFFTKNFFHFGTKIKHCIFKDDFLIL